MTEPGLPLLYDAGGISSVSGSRSWSPIRDSSSRLPKSSPLFALILLPFEIRHLLTLRHWRCAFATEDVPYDEPQDFVQRKIANVSLELGVGKRFAPTANGIIIRAMIMQAFNGKDRRYTRVITMLRESGTISHITLCRQDEYPGFGLGLRIMP